MTEIAKAVEEMYRAAADRAEVEVCALVGTGKDLAVSAMAQTSADGLALKFEAIPGGSTPDYPCTVFRVSNLGPWRTA